MVPSYFRTIREWVHERMEYGPAALGVIDHVSNRLDIPPDVMIDPARIVSALKIVETVTEREING